MKLKLVKTYKSINSVSEDIDLPNFVVITGLNGAGKSHLLDAIANGAVFVNDLNDESKVFPRKFDFDTLKPSNSTTHLIADTANDIKLCWKKFEELKSDFLNEIKKHNPFSNKNDALCYREILSLSDEELIEMVCAKEKSNALPVLEEFKKRFIAKDEEVIDCFSIGFVKFERRPDLRRTRLEESMGKIKSSFNFPLILLEKNEFEEFYPIACDSKPLFENVFSKSFLEHANRFNKNLVSSYHASKKDTRGLADFQERFFKNVKEHPWETINKLLLEMDLSFRVTEPDLQRPEAFQAKLINTISDTEVEFDALSSGEKILMSLLICRYQMDGDAGIADLPNVLLFDEIDATLHPSMTQKMLTIIKTYLVDKLKLIVIMTTHSPSTVALAPVSSLYVMDKSNAGSLKKVTKNEALSVLLQGVPSLQATYENRRQIFVESRNDVFYYESFVDVLSDELQPLISLNFIAFGTEKDGGCAKVKSIVKQLEKKGNKSVFGIIDWDCTNNSEGRVFVLGGKKRYSIDNYIFDPLLVVAYLVHEEYKFEDVHLIKLRYGDLGDASSERLQPYVDYILEKIRVAVEEDASELARKLTEQEDSNSNGSKNISDLSNLKKKKEKADGIFDNINKLSKDVECEYVGGLKLNVKQWYLETKGHDWYAYLSKAFPKLLKGKNKFKSEEEACRRLIIGTVVKHHSKLVPKCILDTLVSIQQPMDAFESVSDPEISSQP